MDKYIAAFPGRLGVIPESSRPMPGFPGHEGLQHIFIAGMGGSAIGAAMAGDLLRDSLQIPYSIVRDYQLPSYAGTHTLVICSTYSGNTEETLSCFEDARLKKCRLVCVGSGGLLQNLARKHHIPFLMLPGGMPPRAALASSVTALLYMLWRCGVTDEKPLAGLRDSGTWLGERQDKIRRHAQEIAEKIKGSIPLVYTGTSLQSAGLRWKQQINENAKMHCFAGVIPEMNHNELAAFTSAGQMYSVLFLTSPQDDGRISRRFAYCQELIAKNVGFSLTLEPEGENIYRQLFYFVHLGDWLSYELALLQKVDPMRIEKLDRLKEMIRSGDGT